MRHTQIKVGQRVLCNPHGTIPGEVTHTIDRKGTHTGRERYKFRVLWEGGKHEWLTAGELKELP